MRIPLAIATVALALTPLAQGSPAHAAATCQGKPATIEASTGFDLRGTSGDDVMVASGTVTTVEAGEGNDTICYQAQTGIVLAMIDAGGGDDVVDTTASAGQVRTDLGTGTDRFVGGSGADWVLSDGGDVISTGDGADRVTASEAAGDSVELGPGDDLVEFSPLGNAAPSSFDLGTGIDEFSIAAGGRKVTADGHQVTALGIRNALFHVENFTVYADRITVRGTPDDNVVTAEGCVVTLSGGAGDDTLFLPTRRPELRCKQAHSSLTGQAGDDILVGNRRDNVLLGGSGHDVARGGSGTDRCVAEKKKACER